MIITSIICTVVIAFYIFSIHQVSDIYIGRTQETILDLEKNFLKDTVNNLISEIETNRKNKIDYMDKLVKSSASVINLKMSLSNGQFYDFVIHYLKSGADYNLWSVFILDNNKVFYDSNNLAGDSWKATLSNVKSRLSSYRIIVRGKNKIVFGVSKSYINELVKAEMSNTIRNLEFDDQTYIRVNEIINYRGGKNYAFRRVQPDLPKTEGTFLSTDMKDKVGNYPYLTELQGLNKDGELFYSYYFKEWNNDNVSEKIAYSKLYKEFNWSISMGIYMNDLQSGIDQHNEESKLLVSRLTLILVSIFIIILFISYATIFMIEKLYYRNSKMLLESELNKDTLTKAGSRRKGTSDLINAFNDFKKNGFSHGILMIDIDNFKHINDTYGHAVGDLVLIEIVKAINHANRRFDKIIRWGGDEFIVIINNINKENVLDLGEKILSEVGHIKIKIGNNVIKPTLSIGISSFQESDTDFNDALNRADMALYQSKTNGRNQVNIML